MVQDKSDASSPLGCKVSCGGMKGRFANRPYAGAKKSSPL